MSSEFRRFKRTKLPPLNGAQSLVTTQQGEESPTGGPVCRVTATWRERRERLDSDSKQGVSVPPPYYDGYSTSLPGRNWDSMQVWPPTDYRSSFGRSANLKPVMSNREVLCDFQSKLNHNEFLSDQSLKHPEPMEKGWVHRELTDMFSETYMRNLPQMTLRRMQRDVAPFHAYMTFYDWGEPPLVQITNQTQYCKQAM